MLSEMFYTLVLTSGVGFLLAVCKYLSKSRCDQIECCFCKIHRNVELENQESRVVEPTS